MSEKINNKQIEALETIYNFIVWYTSDEQEREDMESAATDYVQEDHVLSEDAA
jgi:hypothetical protein